MESSPKEPKITEPTPIDDDSTDQPVTSEKPPKKQGRLKKWWAGLSKKQKIAILAIGIPVLILIVVLIIMALIAKPDLAIGSIKIEDDRFAAGTEQTLTYTIKNEGSAKYKGPLEIIQTLTRDGESLPSVTTSLEETTIREGHSITQTLTIGGVDWTPGLYELVLEIKTPDNIKEKNKTNNKSVAFIFEVIPSGADLLIEDISIDKTEFFADESATITFKVTNDGNVETGTGILLAKHIKRDGQAVSSEDPIVVDQNIQPGEIHNYFLQLDDKNLWTPGSYEVQIEADPVEALAESDEENNISEPVHFTIKARDPDFTFENVSIDKSEFLDTETATIDYTVKNVGPGDYTGKIFVEKDITRDGQTVSTSLETIEGLNSGESKEQSFAVGNSSTWQPGSYELRLKIDPTGTINEENKNDNTSSTLRFTIKPAQADLTVPKISIDKKEFKYLAGATVSLTIKNDGNIATTKGFTIQQVVNRDGQELANTDSLYYSSNVAAGQERDLSFDIGQTSSWPAGSYTLYVKADSTDQIDEGSEQNNESSKINFKITP